MGKPDHGKIKRDGERHFELRPGKGGASHRYIFNTTGIEYGALRRRIPLQLNGKTSMINSGPKKAPSRERVF